MIIAGTIPDKEIPLTVGTVNTDGDWLVVDGRRFPCMQGTGAMVSAALAVCDYLKLERPTVVIAGDIGEGKGSRAIYEYLIANVVSLAPGVLALHYWLPDMALTRKLCEAVEGCNTRPILVADAASMYSAKASGLAPSFDIMTPDATEMAFLADPAATHPAYIARHLFDTDVTQTPNLIGAAYENNGSKLLLVKGVIDYVVRDGEIIETIEEPSVPVLEAIGGTGDTITGLVAALACAGLELHQAAIIAARTNRMAGKFARPTPATKVGEIIRQYPAVFRQYLCEWSGACCIEGGDVDRS